MQTVESIIERIYGSPAEAAAKLGVGTSAIWNWKSWGKFPARLASHIVQHAREAGAELDISEIPLTDAIKRLPNDEPREAAQ